MLRIELAISPSHRTLGWPVLAPTLWCQGPVSRRPTTIKWLQSSQSNCHSTIGTQQTKYHEVLPSSGNDDVRWDYLFSNDGHTPWYLVCRVPMVEWQLDCENCHNLMVVGLHDTGSRCLAVSHRSSSLFFLTVDSGKLSDLPLYCG